MLRPQKGEGERSKLNRSKNNKRKAPQIILTVLIFSTPLCMAESALASTSSFGLQPELQPQSSLQQKASQYLVDNYLGQIQQKRLPFSAPIISETDISALESTLSQYKSRLATLKTKVPLDPSQATTLSQAISALESKISDLESTISEAKKDLASYLSAQKTLSEALSNYAKAQQITKDVEDRVSTATTAYTLATDALAQARASADASLTNLNLVKDRLEQANSNLSSADASLTNQIEITNNALISLNTAKALTNQKLQQLEQAQQDYNASLQNLQQLESQLSTAQNAYHTAVTSLSVAQDAYATAQANLDEAQHNYDTNLIPDPNWTAPTQQVAHTIQVPHTETVVHTTTETQQSANILPAFDTSTWSGAGTGFQGSYPTLNDGVLKFSYMNQTVLYRGTASVSATTPLTLSVDVQNTDANNGNWGADTYSIELITYDANNQQNGYAVYNSEGWHDWLTKQVQVIPTSDVVSYEVRLTGFDMGYWYGTYGPAMRTPELATTITTTTTTYEEITTYTTETYYTVEPVLIEGTIQVAIDEGGQATFTAPEGATFISSSLRYEAKDRPECGANIYPQVNGLNQITIQASNGVWGDPCGGWYKHIVGTLTYLGQPTAPLIHDPALKVILDQARQEYDLAFADYSSATSNFEEKEAELNNLVSVYDIALSNNQEDQISISVLQTELAEAQVFESEKQSLYDSALVEKTRVENFKTQAESVVATTTQEVAVAQASYDEKTSEVVSSEASVDTALATLNVEKANLTAASEGESVALATKSQAEDTATSYQEKATSSVLVASSKSSSISFTDVEEIINKPAPQEEGSKEIPADLSAENLMSVDLSKVDPTELTPEQAEQLVEAALETFETAEQGSPEYEQALDALYLAAEQDDIELPAELAVIPGLQAATELINFLGNAGADMSPKVREESKKIVVTAVVAAGVAVQSVAAAATASASTTSSGSGSTRRK